MSSARARMTELGPSAMTDGDLIEIITRGRGLSEEATERLNDHGLTALVGMEWSELKSLDMSAAIELANRMARAALFDKEPLVHPAAVARYLFLRYASTDQEVFGALYLDTRQRLIRIREIFKGTMQRTAVDPRPIMRDALICSAAGVIMFHNHPSGDPSPSAEDLQFTRRVSDAGDSIGIKLVDHIIIGDPTRWVSLRERGGW